MKLNKLYSLNPRKVKPISLQKASKEYLDYVFHHFNQEYMYGKERCELLLNGKFEEIGIKDFKTWLHTEI